MRTTTLLVLLTTLALGSTPGTAAPRFALLPGGGDGAVAGPGPSAAPADTLPVRVMTYNIHAGKDADGRANLERVAGVIREAGADLVLLQEVDRGTERSGGADQLRRLEELTGLEGAFGKSLDYQGGDYGIALLSRWPIEEAETVPLETEPPRERAGGSHEPRVALSAAVRTPAGLLRVVNTHIDARSSAYRAQEIVGVLAHIAGLRDAVPLLFGGDLNALPESAVARSPEVGLVDLFAACGAGPGESFPADDPVRRIDYLWLRGGGRCASARVVESRASDHRPVVATVEVAWSGRGR